MPRRIVLIRPCCIGDVVLATAALKALRLHFPEAHITWAVGSWSQQAVAHHDLVDDFLDTGSQALPVKSPQEFFRFVQNLRAGQFDLSVSLVRSPLMSLAASLTGIPDRAGIDSAGRGFGYTIRAVVDPDVSQHEAEVYLDVVYALGFDGEPIYANIPVREADQVQMKQRLVENGVVQPYFVIHPGGGRNPGMTMDAKRWPPAHYAKLADALADALDAVPVILAGPQDGAIAQTVTQAMQAEPKQFLGNLTFGEIGALAQDSVIYIGNDTGLTHLAAAVGARTVMILGPSDPARYRPYGPNAIALWRPASVHQRGVTGGTADSWDWERDGISVADAIKDIRTFLG